MEKEKPTKEEMINYISKVIAETHNDKDKQDLLEFSEEELREIYEQII